jgi:hypothetical protein
VKAVGLRTRDEYKAETVCHDVETLCSNEEVLQAPEANLERLRTFERRAIEIVFGREIADRVFAGTEGDVLSREDLNVIRQQLEEARTLAQIDKRDVGIEWTEQDLDDQFIERLTTELNPRNQRVLRELVGTQSKTIRELREENAALRSELVQYRLEHNAVCAQDGAATAYIQT